MESWKKNRKETKTKKWDRQTEEYQNRERVGRAGQINPSAVSDGRITMVMSWITADCLVHHHSAHEHEEASSDLSAVFQENKSSPSIRRLTSVRRKQREGRGGITGDTGAVGDGQDVPTGIQWVNQWYTDRKQSYFLM